MKLKQTIFIKIFVVLAIAASAGILAFVYSQQQTVLKDLDDTIKFERVISSERGEDFIALLAGDNEGIAPNETHVTVYNRDIGLVKESRELDLVDGYNQVKYQDVPEKINPASVIFQDLSNAGTRILEQVYEYDLVSQDKLLEKHLDEEIIVFSSVEGGTKEYRGKLISYKDGVILDTGRGVVSIRDIQSVEFPGSSKDLTTKPTLLWSIFAEERGARNVLTTYLTGGLTWRADYIANVNANDTMVDLKGWVTINNTSGTSYLDSTLKLVAGDVNIVAPPAVSRFYPEVAAMPMMEKMDATDFSEEQFFEYHLYTLGRKTDVKNNQQKQISLFEAANVLVNKQLVYQSSRDWNNVRVMLETENSEEKGLGIPLPKGIVRVYKEDPQRNLQFIGEDRINHIPKDEELDIFLGNAFDVTVEKTVQESTRTGGLLEFGSRCQIQDIEVKLRNHKDENVEVKIVEEWYAPNVSIITSNYKSEKKDAYTYIFRVPVRSSAENSLKYTMRRCW